MLSSHVMLFICESHGKLHYPYCTGRVAGARRDKAVCPRLQKKRVAELGKAPRDPALPDECLKAHQSYSCARSRQADRHAGKTCCWNRRKVLLFAGLLFNFFVLLSAFIPEPRWTWLLWLLTHHCKVKYTASPHWLRKINRTLSPPPTPTPTLPSELEIKNLQKDSRWLCQGGGMVRIGTVYNISALPDQSRFLIQ